MHATRKPNKQKNDDSHCVTEDDFIFFTRKNKRKTRVFVNNDKKIWMRSRHWAFKVDIYGVQTVETNSFETTSFETMFI